LFHIVRDKAEEKYYHDLLQDTKKSLKKLWDTFGPIINPNRVNKKKPINKLIHSGNAVTDKHAISNMFNDYFVGIGEKLTGNMPNSKTNFANI
jgi:hypothetical protein